MGIQVYVEIEDLPEVFKIEYRDKDVPDDRCWEDEKEWGICSHCYGAGCFKTVKELWVKFPKSGWLVSYLDDILIFDNKFANDQFREELEEHDVPYVRC